MTMTYDRALSRPVSFSVCLIAAAVMAACGGGTGSEEPAVATADSSSIVAGQSFDAPVADDGDEFASIAVSDADRLAEAVEFDPDEAAPSDPDPMRRAEALKTGYLDNVAVLVNKTLIPAPAKGIAVELVKPTTDLPAPSDVGAFRTGCNFSHMAFDDPIVFPNQPGRSHLHTFFGNTGTNAYTTAKSIANSGNSTCRGGTANRTAYWVPSMIDTTNGSPIKPQQSAFYYKTGYKGVKPRDVRPLPQGLRMIAGDPKNATPSGPFSFNCKASESSTPAIKEMPNCAAGEELWQTITFPQCWDGVNLDSPDHKSHMAYAKNGCPATHPVALPEITFRVIYLVPETNATRRWRLSSDTYDRRLPAGYSSHGDWFNGWKPEVNNAWTKFCNQASMDCHSHLLGDGRKITF
jgi:hypothetical protein